MQITRVIRDELNARSTKRTVARVVLDCVRATAGSTQIFAFAYIHINVYVYTLSHRVSAGYSVHWGTQRAL